MPELGDERRGDLAEPVAEIAFVHGGQLKDQRHRVLAQAVFLSSFDQHGSGKAQRILLRGERDEQDGGKLVGCWTTMAGRRPVCACPPRAGNSTQ